MAKNNKEKKLEIFWTHWAKFDVQEILDYISEENPHYALKFLEKIDTTVNGLHIFPNKGRKVPEVETTHLENYREIIINPWRLFYKREENRIYIIGIIDGRRNIEDILIKRLMKKE